MNKNILGYLSDHNLPPIGNDHRYNEIDGLVFAIFSSAPAGPDVRRLREAFDARPVGKTMGELSELLIDTDNNELLSSRFGSDTRKEYGRHMQFFTHIAMNKRYRDIKITGFTYNNDGFCQFSAFTFEISPGEYVIAYRGTDNSLEGWYESIKLFHENVPSRQLALDYLQSEMEKCNGIFRLVGHSKGGHLALCAAVMSDLKCKIRIRSIINYDGPGFTTEFISKYYDNILLLQHKTYRFSPADALVSSLLFGEEIMYYEKNMRYVKPYGMKIAHNQHNYFNWSINEDNFTPAPRSNLSILFQSMYAKLHELYSPEELEQIFDQLYEQAADIYKDDDNMLSQLDVLTLLLNAAIKLISASRE